MHRVASGSGQKVGVPAAAAAPAPDGRRPRDHNQPGPLHGGALGDPVTAAVAAAAYIAAAATALPAAPAAAAARDRLETIRKNQEPLRESMPHTRDAAAGAHTPPLSAQPETFLSLKPRPTVSHKKCIN